jgi:hypothetical protein
MTEARTEQTGKIDGFHRKPLMGQSFTRRKHLTLKATAAIPI